MFEPEEVSKEGGAKLILVSTADYSIFYCMINPGLATCKESFNKALQVDSKYNCYDRLISQGGRMINKTNRA